MIKAYAVHEPEGERKYVTALFSDLSGYTAMSEELDPEEVKEITGRILGEISQIVSKYEGFVEKFVGDAVMALFGVPKAHEDDSVKPQIREEDWATYFHAHRHQYRPCSHW